jgi:signal transduction histidine kinase
MQRTDIEVDCQIGELPQRIPKPIELCLYRIAQESLWNAGKHSGASRITVKLAGDGERVRLEVADNGRGLGNIARPPSKGLGLASIKERVRLVAGKVEIESDPGKGTRIVALVPLRSFES